MARRSFFKRSAAGSRSDLGLGRGSNKFRSSLFLSVDSRRGDRRSHWQGRTVPSVSRSPRETRPDGLPIATANCVFGSPGGTAVRHMAHHELMALFRKPLGYASRLPSIVIGAVHRAGKKRRSMDVVSGRDDGSRRCSSHYENATLQALLLEPPASLEIVWIR